jgi:predicted DNA-binding WGR domain protein
MTTKGRSRILVEGTALHFFDAGLGQRGSDKFYRAFIYESPAGHWNAIMCWGRDGTQGQAKVQQFASKYDANKVIQKKIAEKMRHGYEILGNGQAILDVLNRREEVLGAEFADAVSEREADKTRMTGGIIIQEEPDLMDLLG